ncbi:MAG TPA: LTA synthase family protein [Candidatus Eisenbacteria bacterium]|nr:LTA synthase family protein [Candidatus Eisenbacteria bacterium]
MGNDVPTPQSSWKRSRYGFAAFWFVSLLVGWFILRLILFFSFKPVGIPASEVSAAFLSGLLRDVFAGLVLTLPLLAWMLILPNRAWSARWHRVLFICACVFFAFLLIFLLFVEFFFFDEFKSRYNTVAVDYLIYPQEVFVNIWESYHVGIIVIVCLAVAVGWLFAVSRLFPQMWGRPYPLKTRVLCFGGVAVAATLLGFTLNLKAARVSTDRTLNEIANNGALSFAAAAWTHHLDYSAFYKTLPKDEAYKRTRRMLTEPSTKFVEQGQSIRRRAAGDPNNPKLNVVIFLEESLGSEFWGCLGRKDTLTPEMDQLAADCGMLFTNLYACGNRTVRGMEGVLSSFPPLPGDSIVKRDLSDNVETIARVLKRDGYSTVFLYGGRGAFDGMRSYAVRNGYDRFIEHNPPFHDDFPNSTFTTAWGVSDEDIFAKAVEECRALSQTGKPFFATILSVSNHKPYTYPKGRIPEDPDKNKRNYAVKYSDYALGQFFRAAKKEPFWTNTIFAVVADHGARVYGKQSIPIHSYEIPLVILGPAVVKEPSRVGQLGSSLDVAPTLLGLVGRPYETMFFGRDLLKMQPSDGRVTLNHNRDIGMMANDRLVVLGLMQTVEFYQGDPKVVEMSLLSKPTDSDLDLEKDTAAIYQVADDLYMHRQYRTDSSPVVQQATSR